VLVFNRHREVNPVQVEPVAAPTGNQCLADYRGQDCGKQARIFPAADISSILMRMAESQKLIQWLALQESGIKR
jgi:hypothetical protein